MSGDVGRAVAVLLAIALAITAPLAIRGEIRSNTVNSLAQAAVDELTAQVEKDSAVTLAAYERLLNRLSEIGLICDTRMQIGLHELKYSDAETAIEVPVTHVQLCAAHVHTDACYRGHNHEASACVYHSHDSSCYCSGKMTRYYRSESSFRSCTNCGGSGSTGSTATCLDCRGTGTITRELKCNNCTGGRTYQPEKCSKCNGTGVNSKGKSCTNCNATGYVDVRVTCSVCNGKGYRYKDFDCTTCRGKGTVSTLTACKSCNGAGGSYVTTDYYECSTCGGGSTTAYGSACGRRICGYQTTGYVCGYTSNDTNPICGQVIVDVSYAENQTVNIDDTTDTLNLSMEVTYLNGTSGTVDTIIEKPQTFSNPGDVTVEMSHTGYFERASLYETRRFPIHISVLNGGKVCEVCKRTYYPEEDDDTAGCPYCYHGIIGIRVECLKTEYRKGEQLEADVYAVFDDGHESKLPTEDTWNTFDSEYPGEVTVFVGYLQYIEEISVFVREEENPAVTPSPTEEPEKNDEDSDAQDDTEQPGNEETGATNGDGELTEDTGHIAENHVVADTAYEEFLTTEEIESLLEKSGRIELSSGDAFSVRITVRNMKGFDSLRKNGSRVFTSGIIID